MTAVLMLLASLTPATGTGTGTAGTIWLARRWLRNRTEIAGRTFRSTGR
jgi:hypothetical protein